MVTSRHARGASTRSNSVGRRRVARPPNDSIAISVGVLSEKALAEARGATPDDLVAMPVPSLAAGRREWTSGALAEAQARGPSASRRPANNQRLG